MDLPCLACGRTFSAQKKLSAHVSQCSRKQALKLTDPLYHTKKKRKPDKASGKKSKRARSDRRELIQLGTDNEGLQDYMDMDMGADAIDFEQVSDINTFITI